MAADRRPWSEIVAFFTNLGLELEAHFKSEEEILDRTEFPRAAAHKLQHRRLQRQLAELTNSLSSVDGSSSEHWRKISSIRETLLELLFRHDLDYKSHLQYSIGQ